MANNKRTVFHGYEDYLVFNISPSFFRQGYDTPWNIRMVDTKYKILYPIEDKYTELNKDMSSKILPMENHPELLEKAKKLYIHPNCTIPRDIVSKKYKRCLDPIVADAIVIPGTQDWEFYKTKYTAVFINSNYKRVYICSFNEWYDPNKPIMDKLKDASGETTIADLSNYTSSAYCEVNEAKQAKLIYYGPIAYFENSNMFIFDTLTYKLFPSKMVTQDAVSKIINGKDNIPTVELLLSINDMLKSNDIDTVDLGLKTLATLDYNYYPESILAVMLESPYWKKGKAVNSTAVKYMFKSLGIDNKHIFSGSTNKFISKKDYELYSQFMEKLDPNYLNYIGTNSFMYIDESLVPKPRFKNE